MGVEALGEGLVGEGIGDAGIGGVGGLVGSLAVEAVAEVEVEYTAAVAAVEVGLGIAGAEVLAAADAAELAVKTVVAVVLPV